MKKLIALTAFLLVVLGSPTFAGEVTVGYDYYHSSSAGQNADDGQGFTVGYKRGLIGSLSGRVDVSYITGIDFAEARDPKGSWGELRGYGAVFNLVYDLRYSDRLNFSLYAGTGPFWWNFKENPFLQDNQVTVDVDSSVLYRLGAGADYKLKDGWVIEVQVGWQDTNIPKDARDSQGKEWNILDADGNIGFQSIQTRIGIRKKF